MHELNHVYFLSPGIWDPDEENDDQDDIKGFDITDLDPNALGKARSIRTVEVDGFSMKTSWLSQGCISAMRCHCYGLSTVSRFA